MKQNVLLIGASVRAIAESASRAGLDVIGFDLFGDWDTRRACSSTTQLQQFDLASATLNLPRLDGWAFTGRIEHRPKIIQQLNRMAPLWGFPAESIARVCDPWAVARAFENRPINFPGIRRDLSQIRPVDDGPWIAKPLRAQSCGESIFLIDHHNAASFSPRTHYLQQKISGRSISALFVATADAAHFLGATRQLVGDTRFGAPGFVYCGSIGPLQLSELAVKNIAQIGQTLHQEFEMRGLFGLDLVENDRGFWLIEINPRYTAAAEVIESKINRSIFDLHRTACQHPEFFLCAATTANAGNRIWGKSILFSSFDGAVTVTAEMHDKLQEGYWDGEYRDIPMPGTEIKPGAPILTALACGTDEQTVIDCLEERSQKIREFWAPTAGIRQS